MLSLGLQQAMTTIILILIVFVILLLGVRIIIDKTIPKEK
jgi:hypothetical protein